MSEYGWTPDYVRKRLPGAEGWIYYCWAVEKEITVAGGKVYRKSPGYVKQEWLRLMEMAKAELEKE